MCQDPEGKTSPNHNTSITVYLVFALIWRFWISTSLTLYIMTQHLHYCMTCWNQMLPRPLWVVQTQLLSFIMLSEAWRVWCRSCTLPGHPLQRRLATLKLVNLSLQNDGLQFGNGIIICSRLLSQKHWFSKIIADVFPLWLCVQHRSCTLALFFVIYCFCFFNNIMGQILELKESLLFLFLHGCTCLVQLNKNGGITDRWAVLPAKDKERSEWSSAGHPLPGSAEPAGLPSPLWPGLGPVLGRSAAAWSKGSNKHLEIIHNHQCTLIMQIDKLSSRWTVYVLFWPFRFSSLIVFVFFVYMQ